MKSEIEAAFEFQLRAASLPAWKREHRFHPVRKWRFDFAWPDVMIAAEIEGGTWSGGRHTRGSGFAEDCIKYNEATLLGWRVYRFTSAHVNDGTALRYIEMAIEKER